MTSIPQPSEEREKEYKALQEKAKKIHEVIVTSYLKDELTPFDLLAYSCNTFAQSAVLFPAYVPAIKGIMRELITMSMESKLPPEEQKKKSGLVGIDGSEL